MIHASANLAMKFGMEKMNPEIDDSLMHVMTSIACSLQEFIVMRNSIVK